MFVYKKPAKELNMNKYLVQRAIYVTMLVDAENVNDAKEFAIALPLEEWTSESPDTIEVSKWQGYHTSEELA